MRKYAARDLRRFGFFPKSTPLPAIGGLKAKSRRGDIGETWWSRRFLAILESFGFGSRLDRGRSYARRGQVLEWAVTPGEIKARVQGSRRAPYNVRIALKPLSDVDWRRAELAMSRRALFAAKLLAGEMPQQIEEAFTECRLSLFPASGRELASGCTCPDWASPCKHVAAVFYLFAEALDEDPFLAFTWRGRTREQLVERLRSLRGGGDKAPMAALDLRSMLNAGPPLRECVQRFWDAGPELTTVVARPKAAEIPDAVLRQLGDSGIRVGRLDLVEVLAPAYPVITRGVERRAVGSTD
ncbi:MAG: SWIM zinc finger family protein [Candidatus Dormibacteraceae bacterium]